MKSAHRHELETNALAHRLEVYVERFKPYIGKVGVGLLVFIALLFIWSYVNRSSSYRQSEAWDAYNQAVGSLPLNLTQLRRTAEEFPNSQMQKMADVTWADGQVFAASRSYIANRAAAKDALGKAASAYEGIIRSSDDERLVGHARLGLGRVYEMQNQLDKARAQYEQVTGPYAAYAKVQAERLANPEAKETYNWLATAQAPAPRAPMGPGTPGQQPEFSPGDISLPNGSGATPGTPSQSKNAAETFDALLKDLQKESKEGEADDRYKTTQPPAPGAMPESAKETAPPADAKKSDETPAKDGAAKTNSVPVAPAGEKSAN